MIETVGQNLDRMHTTVLGLMDRFELHASHPFHFFPIGVPRFSREKRVEVTDREGKEFLAGIPKFFAGGIINYQMLPSGVMKKTASAIFSKVKLLHSSSLSEQLFRGSSPFLAASSSWFSCSSSSRRSWHSWSRRRVSSAPPRLRVSVFLP